MDIVCAGNWLRLLWPVIWGNLKRTFPSAKTDGVVSEQWLVIGGSRESSAVLTGKVWTRNFTFKVTNCNFYNILATATLYKGYESNAA